MAFSISPLLTSDERIVLMHMLHDYERANPIRIVAVTVLPADPAVAKATLCVGYIFNRDFLETHNQRDLESPEAEGFVTPLTIPGFNVRLDSMHRLWDFSIYGGDAAYGEQLIRSRMLEAHQGMYGICRLNSLKRSLEECHASLPDIALNEGIQRRKGLVPPVYSQEERERIEFEKRLLRIIDYTLDQKPVLCESRVLLMAEVIRVMKEQPDLDPVYSFQKTRVQIEREFVMKQLIESHPGLRVIQPRQVRISCAFADSVETIHDVPMRTVIAEDLGFGPVPQEEFVGL